MAASFGRYSLIATLGRGGMADVYLAAMRGAAGVQKLIVIKRLRAEIAEDPRFTEMFLHEARLAAQLQHPNVVQTFEVGDHDGHLFLAMEYLDGQPLNRFLTTAREPSAQGPLFGARIVADALAGLHYAHELAGYDGQPLGIVHRDVSPHNLFVTYTGQVKLVDFGIAKATSVRGESTESGVLKGKLAYMAPEQLLGTPLDRRADVFSMGVVLWELVTRRRLFRADNQAETMRRLLDEDAPRLARVRPGTPAGLDAIAARALTRDPTQRFATAGEMRAALEEVLERAQPRAPRGDEIGQTIAELFAAERQEVGATIRAAMQAAPDAPMPTAPTASGAFGSLPPLLPPSAHESNSFPAPTPAPTPVAITAPPPPPARNPGRPTSVVVAAALSALSLAGAAGFFAWRYAIKRAPAPAALAKSAAPAPSTAPAAPAVVLRLEGSNTIGAELAPALAEAFLTKRGGEAITRRVAPDGKETWITAALPGFDAPQAIAVRAEGSATAFEGLAKGTADIGMSSRPVNDEEAAKLGGASFGDMRSPSNEHVLALDGIAVVVHAGNSVRTIRREALRDVFTGKVSDWSALGAAPAPIHVRARDDKSGTFDTFKHLVLGAQPLVGGAQRYGDSSALADAVASDPLSIGFVGLASVRNTRALAVGDAATVPTYPTPFTVTTEDYLLSRRLYLYTSAQPARRMTQEFVSFALSSAGQAVVRQGGFADLDVTVREPEPCGAGCTPAYARATAKARRASLDFRFRSGKNDLDSRGFRDLDRLLAYLRGRARGEGGLRLLGFSDASGDPAANLELSLARAKAVADELAARGVRATVVAGFGADMPIAANGDASGREKNRRVEVWLAD